MTPPADRFARLRAIYTTGNFAELCKGYREMLAALDAAEVQARTLERDFEQRITNALLVNEARLDEIADLKIGKRAAEALAAAVLAKYDGEHCYDCNAWVDSSSTRFRIMRHHKENCVVNLAMIYTASKNAS